MPAVPTVKPTGLGPASGTQGASPLADPPEPSPSKLEARLGALRDLRWASLASAVVALELLALSIPGVFVPGSGFIASFSVSAGFDAPPPWNQILLPPPVTSSAAGWAIASLVTLVGVVFGGVAFAYLVGAYRIVRRAAKEFSLPGAEKIGWAQWCLIGAVLTGVLYVITLGATWAFLITPPTGPVSPQAFIAGDRQGLAAAGGILALWMVLFVVLITTAYQVLSEIAAPGENRFATRRALDLMIVGSLFYFAIIATPFWNPAPFTATLDFFGSNSPEMVLLTLPAWIFLGLGAILLARTYGRDLSSTPSQSALSSPPALISPAAGGPAESTIVTLPSTGAQKPDHSTLGGRGVVWVMAVGVTLLVYAAPFAGTSFGELGHWSCVPGTRVANESVWYPVLIINAPYGGYANGTSAQIDPSGNGWETDTIGATSGNTTVLAVLNYWNIYTTHAALLPGPGADVPCTGPFVAQASSGNAHPMADFRLADPSNETDRGLPTNFNVSVFSNGSAESAVFNASYTVPTAAPYDNCNGASGVTARWTAYSEYVRFQIPFSWAGKPELVGVTQYALANYTYSTTATGVFNMEDLKGEPSGFDSGLAFDREPCS
jgi:hypothetical protein